MSLPINILTLDPAAGGTSAIARWSAGALAEVKLVRGVRAMLGESPGSRCHRTVAQIREELVSWRQRQVAVDILVWEWPHVYQRERSHADPADLLALAAVGGAVAAVAESLWPGLVVKTVEPGEWSGQVPKNKTGDPWASPRGRRIHERLTATERALVPRSHDALDAVGIGLHALGRFAPRRVFPGAS